MRASVTRQEALRLLKIEHQAVNKLINELSDDEMTRPDTIRYGLYSDQECSFKDLLAHLICYEVYTIEAIEDWKINAKHWVIDAMQDYRESTKIHYDGISDREHLSLQEQIDEYQQTAEQLENLLAELSDKEWREEAFYPTDEPTDLGGMIEQIMVAPPRPMYRHLPVHIPNIDAYISSLRTKPVQS